MKKESIYTAPTIGKVLAFHGHQGVLTYEQKKHKVTADILRAMGFPDTYQMTHAIVDFTPEVQRALRITTTDVENRDFIWLCKQLSRFFYSGLFGEITNVRIVMCVPNAPSIVDPAGQGKPFFYKRFSNKETGNEFLIGFNYD